MWSTALGQKDPWLEQCGVEYSSKTERSMVGAMWCGVQLKDRKIHGGSNVALSTAQRQKDPWWEQCVVEYSSRTERSMVGAMWCGVQLKDRKRSMVGAMWCGVQLKDRKIHGRSNVVWSTAQRQEDPWLEQCGVEYSSKTERSMVGAMWCGVQLKDRKRSTDLMFMLGLNDTIDQLAMTNSVHW